jgi:hypothetical protein
LVNFYEDLLAFTVPVNKQAVRGAEQVTPVAIGIWVAGGRAQDEIGVQGFVQLLEATPVCRFVL